MADTLTPDSFEASLTPDSFEAQQQPKSGVVPRFDAENQAYADRIFSGEGIPHPFITGLMHGTVDTAGALLGGVLSDIPLSDWLETKPGQVLNKLLSHPKVQQAVKDAAKSWIDEIPGVKAVKKTYGAAKTVSDVAQDVLQTPASVPTTGMTIGPQGRIASPTVTVTGPIPTGTINVPAEAAVSTEQSIPNNIPKQVWEKLDPKTQKAILKAAEARASVAETPAAAAEVPIDVAPVRATPAPAEAPAVIPESPVDTSAIQTKDPFTQLTKQIDELNAARKEVEQAIPSEAGQSITPQEAASRRAVADKGAKYLASKGLTAGKIESMRQTNPGMYQSLRDKVGGIASKRKGYSPSDDTWDVMMERLAGLEGQGKITAPVVQAPPSPVTIDPAILAQLPANLRNNPQALQTAMRLAQSLASQ